MISFLSFLTANNCNIFHVGSFHVLERFTSLYFYLYLVMRCVLLVLLLFVLLAGRLVDAKKKVYTTLDHSDIHHHISRLFDSIFLI